MGDIAFTAVAGPKSTTQPTMRPQRPNAASMRLLVLMSTRWGVVAVGATEIVTTAVATTKRAAVVPPLATGERAAVMKKWQAGLAVVAVGTQENAASAVAVINCPMKQASAGVKRL